MKHNWMGVIQELQGSNYIWDYVTALRGPDSGDVKDTYKSYVTAVLRGHCSCAMSFYGIDRLPPKKNFGTVLKRIPFHAKNHARYGFYALAKYYEYKGGGEKVVTSLHAMGLAVVSDDVETFVKARRDFKRQWK